MNTIDISHSHSLTLKQARKVAEELADELAHEHRLEHEWEDDTLYFSRSGVNGHIDVTTDSIDIHVKLGWLLAAMRGSIENEIQRVLGRHFQ